MTYIENIIRDVRYITDFPEMVFSDDEIEQSIKFTQSEIRSMLREPDFEFEEDNFFAKKATMWGTCYHLKIKTGEIGGIPITIGDVDLAHMRQRGEDDPDLFSWTEKFYENFYKIDGAPLGFGQSFTSREGREYEAPTRTDYGE